MQVKNKDAEFSQLFKLVVSQENIDRENLELDFQYKYQVSEMKPSLCIELKGMPVIPLDVEKLIYEILGKYKELGGRTIIFLVTEVSFSKLIEFQIERIASKSGLFAVVNDCYKNALYDLYKKNAMTEEELIYQLSNNGVQLNVF